MACRETRGASFSSPVHAVALRRRRTTCARAQEAIYVVRHAERADQSPDSPLSTDGVGRAAALEQTCCATPASPTSSPPSRGARSRPPSRWPPRCSLTPQQLPGADVAALAARADGARSPHDRALVVGHSNTVPELLRALNVDDADHNRRFRIRQPVHRRSAERRGTGPAAVEVLTAPRERLHGNLSTVEYFTFGFGSMIGVGWVVLMDDWLARGGPGGGMLGFLIGGLLLFPIAHTYGRLVQRIRTPAPRSPTPKACFRRWSASRAGWTMVLAYAIVCPWEAVATGNLLARVFPALNTYELYAIAGTPIYAPRLAVGLALTALIVVINYRGIKPSGVFQDVMTFGLLATFAIFTVLGFARGSTREHAAAVPAARQRRACCCRSSWCCRSSRTS